MVDYQAWSLRSRVHILDPSVCNSERLISQPKLTPKLRNFTNRLYEPTWPILNSSCMQHIVEAQLHIHSLDKWKLSHEPNYFILLFPHLHINVSISLRISLMEYSKERDSKILELFPAELWSDETWLKPWYKTLAQDSEAQSKEYKNAPHKTSTRTFHVRDVRVLRPDRKERTSVCRPTSITSFFIMSQQKQCFEVNLTTLILYKNPFWR